MKEKLDGIQRGMRNRKNILFVIGDVIVRLFVDWDGVIE